MEPTVTREIELDVEPEELWRLVTEGEELGRWLADEAELEPVVGGQGRFVEDDRVRRAVVDEVEDGRRLAFRWWDEDEGEAGASRVVITLVPSGDTTRLVVHEMLAVASASASVVASAAGSATGPAVPSLRWDVRLGCLGMLLALVRV